MTKYYWIRTGQRAKELTRNEYWNIIQTENSRTPGNNCKRLISIHYNTIKFSQGKQHIVFEGLSCHELKLILSAWLGGLLKL